jgi:hypothetical protein
MDNGDFAKSWETAAPYFQRSLTQDEWVSRLRKVRHPLGPVLSRKFESGQFKNSGMWFEAKYISSFDGLLAATETVTFAKQSNGEWLAIGYLIRPKSIPEKTVTVPDWKKLRQTILFWTVSLTLTWLGMAFNFTPVAYGVGIGIWGVTLFLIPVLMVLSADEDSDRIKLAAQFTCVNGLVLSLAGLYCAFHSDRLQGAWVYVVSVGCLGGGRYCVNGLMKSSRWETDLPDKLGYLAFFFAILSSLIPTIFYWLQPWLIPGLSPEIQQFMLWLTLLAAIVTVILGGIARRHCLGWTSFGMGGVSLCIWLVFYLTFQLQFVPLLTTLKPGIPVSQIGQPDTTAVIKTELHFIELPGSVTDDVTKLDLAAVEKIPGAETLSAPQVRSTSGKECMISVMGGSGRSSLALSEGVEARLVPTLDGDTVHYVIQLSVRERQNPDDTRRTLNHELSQSGNAVLGRPVMVEIGGSNNGRRYLARLLFQLETPAPKPEATR